MAGSPLYDSTPTSSPRPVLTGPGAASAAPGIERRQKGSPELALLRPRQWVKNAFVVAPLIFSGRFTEGGASIEALVAVALFCVAASAVYVFNDLHDLEADRQHPVKRETRPLASGAVTPRRAWTIFALLSVALLAGFFWQVTTTLVVLGYVALNVAYTIRLKQVPVVDLFVLASGFVLRVYAGAVAIAVPLSSWMLITTLCLALYLAAVKRRQELELNGTGGRLVLASYSVKLLERYAEMSAVGAIIFYGLFVITVHPDLAMTIPFVLFGLFRYWYLVERGGAESPTEAVLTDAGLLVTVLLWALMCAIALMPR